MVFPLDEITNGAEAQTTKNGGAHMSAVRSLDARSCFARMALTSRRARLAPGALVGQMVRTRAC